MSSPAFCGQCGAELVEAAAYCTACGAAVPPPVVAPAVPTVPVQSTQGRYVWLCVVVALLSLILARAAFNVIVMLFLGQEDIAAKVGGAILIVLILLAWPANRLWKSILAFEPQSDPLFKRKHGKFTAITGGLVGTLLAVSVLGGIVAGSARAKEKADIASVAAPLTAQKQKYDEFSKRLAALRSTRPSTYEEYCTQCMALETLLNEAQPAIERYKLLQARYWATVNKYPDLRTPTLQTQAKLVKDMEDEDGEFFAALRDEIAKAKDLKALPTSQRDAYYHREIVPLLAKEQRIGDEERRILAEEKKNMAPMPTDISNSMQH